MYGPPSIFGTPTPKEIIAPNIYIVSANLQVFIYLLFLFIYLYIFERAWNSALQLFVPQSLLIKLINYLAN